MMTLSLAYRSLAPNGYVIHLLIVNLSFLEGRFFPDQLKMSIIKPLFKKGDKTDASNYRPITLVPIISKILFKVMLSRLNHFPAKHKILHADQFGFRKGVQHL